MAYEKQAVNWGVAILASVVLHAVVIGLATMSSGENGVVSPETERAPEENSLKPSEVLPEKTTPEKVTPVTPVTPVTSAPQVAPAVPSEDKSIPETYTIKQGDTLTKIAKIYGLSVEEIAAANGKSAKKMNVLWVGQKIKLR